MCDRGCCDTAGLFFVFDELDRKKKPCLDLSNPSDAILFVDAMNFSKKNCVRLDGCCSSRVHTSVAYLSGLLNPPPSDTQNIDALLKDVLKNNCPKPCCACDM